MEQYIVFGVLVATLILFILGKWRYDLVALMALLALVIADRVPGVGTIVAAGEAFVGFGHPAVITVAAVLIVGRGLLNSGVVDVLSGWVGKVGSRPTAQVAALTALTAVCSAFMNNVGALAILMPVAIQMARKAKRSPSYILMPIAFGSLLGGMTTMIGTPPNIIIASFRARTGSGEPFGMFDFSPVGLGVATAGVLFIALLGWRMVPKRQSGASRDAMFQIDDYTTEVRVSDGSGVPGQYLRDIKVLRENEVVVISIIRGKRKIPAPSSHDRLKENDILLVEADSEALKALVDSKAFELVSDTGPGSEKLKSSEEVTMTEAVLAPNSPLVGKTGRAIHLRWRFGVVLIAVARQGTRIRRRLGDIRFKGGDILLLRGPETMLAEATRRLGCFPLAARAVRLGLPRKLVLSTLLFAGALATAVFGLLPIPIALVSAAVGMVLLRLLSVREAYDAVQWPIIILLAAMIPIGQAMEDTGGAQAIADQLVDVSARLSAPAVLAILLVGTMFLSDVVNNAAAAVLMAPIAIQVAAGLGVSADPFLMSICIGASCAFLTPIGHQSNTLVLGPGGYRFGDYWRMGLVLELIVAAISVPLLLYFWPL